MKPIPILVVTNAIALGLVAILFLKQEDLKSQLSSGRTSLRADNGSDNGEMSARLKKLEERLRVRADGDDTELASGVPTDTDNASSDGTAATEGGLPPLTDEQMEELRSGSKDAVMEDFRKRVRLAQELNQREDRSNRVKDRLDELASDSKIAPLNDEQKDKVVAITFASQERSRNMWRKMRDLGDMSREERRDFMRTEFDSLRAEMQKDLESVVPAADAKTLIDSNLMFSGARGMFGGDTGGTARRGRRGGAGR